MIPPGIFQRLAGSKFRARFRLSEKDRAVIAEKGWNVIRCEAEKIIRERLAPAEPRNDGKQTPMRGYPVFPAQHATATCCRGCFEKWYGIPQHRPLTEEEIELAVDVILAWLREKSGDLSGFPRTPDLFPE